MEFWLIQGNEKLQLPVPPPNYKLKTSNNNSSFIVEGLGEVSFLGKPKLTEITPITSFFPSQVYSFCQYTDFPTPSDCIKLIEKWRLSGNPIRYIITETVVNILCSIESFEFGEEDGSGDVNFTLELKEYKLINSPSQVVSGTANSLSFNASNSLITNVRPIDKTIPSSYIVMAGDTLYLIAKRFYGDGSKWSDIASNNLIANPSNLQVGMVLKL